MHYLAMYQVRPLPQFFLFAFYQRPHLEEDVILFCFFQQLPFNFPRTVDRALYAETAEIQGRMLMRKDPMTHFN